jgi:hypothetical protein
MTEKKTWTAGLSMLAVIMAAILLGIFWQGCEPYKAAWASLRSVQVAAQGVDVGIATAHKVKRGKCNEAFKPGTPAAIKCLVESKQHEALKQWQVYAKPAVKSAIVLTAASLEIAQKSGDKGYKWRDSLLPAVCALSRTISEFGHLFPPSAKWLKDVAALAKGFTCPKK